MGIKQANRCLNGEDLQAINIESDQLMGRDCASAMDSDRPPEFDSCRSKLLIAKDVNFQIATTAVKAAVFRSVSPPSRGGA